jgi:hypothetical protein
VGGAFGVYDKVIAMHARTDPEQWIGVVLAVYIIVRGLEKLEKWRKDSKTAKNSSDGPTI